MAKPLITLNITEAQLEVWRAALDGQKQSDVLRGLMRDFVQAQGIKWPDDMPQHGGWRGSEKSLENLVHYVDTLTDTGRNDPAE